MIIIIRGGYCIENFERHLQRSLNLPEIVDGDSSTRYTVPLLFRIDKDGSIYDLAVDENIKTYFHNSKTTRSDDFGLEALTLLNSSGKWVPYSNNGSYVNRDCRLVIEFNYHPEYFLETTDKVVLNPDVKAKYIGDQKQYERYTNPENGCDGAVTCMTIVEPDGSLTNGLGISAIGKINSEMSLFYLQKLTPWNTAVKDGVKVRSQVKITIRR